VLEDVNVESVSSWSAALYSLCIRPHELSEADIPHSTSAAELCVWLAGAYRFSSLERREHSHADQNGRRAKRYTTSTSAFLLSFLLVLCCVTAGFSNSFL
jgi:hypothetical protein